MEEHRILIFFSAVLVLGIAAQWLAWRLHLPSILLLLAFGFAAGNLGGADPDQLIETKILFPIVSLAVAVILFEGGLSLHFGELKEAGSVVLRLVTLGVLVSWILISIACWMLVGMDAPVATLTGAILVVTGPTVIAPLLRTIRPVKRVGSIVKWEGIVIDPVGAVLAVLVYEAVIGEPEQIVPALSTTIVVGVATGCITAFLLVQLLKRYWLPDFLHNPAFLAAALGTFAFSNYMADESGLVTVTVLGVMLRNQRSVAVRHVVEFKENLRVLLISCLFIVLAARIKLSDLTEVGVGGIGLLVVLILIVRPLSVLASTARSELSWNERIFLACLAPRGIVAAAVSSVFALRVAEKELPGSDQIVAVTFLVIVGTVAIYGLLAAPLARRLGLAEPNPQGVLFAGAESWVRPIAEVLMKEGFQVLLIDTNYRHITAMRMAGIPAHCASILSEYVVEELDIGAIGKLLAVTANDDLNSLATIEFAQLFGRKEVYQLSPWDSVAAKGEVPSHIRGRDLFGENVTHGDLAFRIASGAVVKKTRITDEFTYEDFLTMYGETCLLLFIISESGQLNVMTADDDTTPKPGQTVIALVDEADEEPAS